MEIKQNKYEDATYEEIDKKLQEYKQNLSGIENILEREKEKNQQINNVPRIQELIKVQKDLLSAIAFQEEILKFKIINDPLIFNSLPLDSACVGKMCSAYFEEEANWFLAMVNGVNEKEMRGEVTWLGYKEKGTIPFSYIKINETLKKENLEVGMFCDAIYYEEGKWYNASIEKISELGVHVKYKKYEDVEVVSFDSIRITPEQYLINKKKKEQVSKAVEKEDDLVFKLPEHLKILPTDNEQQRLLKRKRVKGLKQSIKQKVIEKESKDRQDNWLNFAEAQKISKFKGITPMKKIDKLSK